MTIPKRLNNNNNPYVKDPQEYCITITMQGV